MIRAVTVALVVIIAGSSTPAAADPTTIHNHASERYDRSLPLLRADVHRHTRQPADLATFTEIQQPPRARTLHKLDDGWTGYTDPRTDVGIMWRNRKWNEIHRHRTRLTPHTYRTWTRGTTKRTYAITAILQADPPRTGRLLVTVAHLPAGIQRGDRFNARTPQRNRVWADAVRGWATYVDRARQRWHPDAVLVVADWNADLRRPAWRHRLRAFHLRPTWTIGHLPRRGTQGRDRLIDGTLTNLRGRARLLPWTPVSDHAPYRERLR